MPIRPENRARYPADWKAISDRIRFERAAGKCECHGECGHDHFHEQIEASGVDEFDETRCTAMHDAPHPITGSHTVLTVAHLDHQLDDHTDANLRAMCQRCHLAFDRAQHAQSAYYTRRCPLTRDLFDS